MPGVSGGTIALLVGIYEELIKSISELNISLFSELKKNGFNSFWKKLNGNFLLVLSLGIGISLISFVKISANLLENFPLYIWSFFLGLIFATIYVIYKISTFYVKTFIGKSVNNFKKSKKSNKKGILDEEGDFIDYEEVD